jgi:hypothetical protein
MTLSTTGRIFPGESVCASSKRVGASASGGHIPPRQAQRASGGLGADAERTGSWTQSNIKQTPGLTPHRLKRFSLPMI